MTRIRRYSSLILAAVSVTWPVALLAQEPDLRLPITVDADSVAYDGRNSMLMYQGLKLNQGSIGIEADEGRASNLDFEDSVWEFTGVGNAPRKHREELTFENVQLAQRSYK